MKRGSFVQLTVFLVLFLVIAVFFFWGGRHVSPELARLERILAVLEKHPDYFWRVRPHLDTQFEGGRLATDGHGFRLLRPGSADPIPENSYRVFVFGASPTFGYGIEADQTYTKVAERLIQRTSPEVSLKNIGQIGYSSFQGRRLFRDVLRRETPDLVTVSYMVNDIDRLRFFFSNGKDDLHTDFPTPFSASFYNRVYAFAPTAWFLKHQRRLLVTLFEGLSRRGNYELSHVRVRPADYERHLVGFVEDCRQKSIPLIFIKMPFRLPDLIPPAPAGQIEDLARIDDLVEAEKYEEAESMIEDVPAKDPYSSKGLYYQGRVLESKGQKEQAHETYAQAVKFLIYDCQRDANHYNDMMESVAVRTKTPLVDAAAGLGSDRADMDLFVPNDYIHPNAEGHRMIGKCLSRSIERIRLAGDEMFIERCGQEMN